MKTARDIIDRVGRDTIRDSFGVKDRVIQHHIKRGILPADWYAALCDLAGQDLPRHLFTFKGINA